jgi:hypothetical protein
MKTYQSDLIKRVALNSALIKIGVVADEVGGIGG